MGRRFQVDWPKAKDDLITQLQRWGVDYGDIDISTKLDARHTGKVVVEFLKPADEGQHERFRMECDKFDSPTDNLRAIGLTVKAKRALVRYGVSSDASELQAFAYLPAQASSAARSKTAAEVLKVSDDAPESVIQAAYKARVKELHPDLGGDDQQFMELQRARDAMLEGAR